MKNHLRLRRNGEAEVVMVIRLFLLHGNGLLDVVPRRDKFDDRLKL